MKNRKHGAILMSMMMTALLSMAGGIAVAANDTGAKSVESAQQKHGHDRMKPELAAKREMVRKQQDQRITPDKRKAAAEALKAERLRVYQAKQAVKQSPPAAIDNK